MYNLYEGVCNRNCGYCGRTFFFDLRAFITHINYCELLCVYKHYGQEFEDGESEGKFYEDEL